MSTKHLNDSDGARMRKIWICAAIAATFLLLVAQRSAFARMLPAYTIAEMCDRADLIAEGTCAEKNTVLVKKIYKGQAYLKDAVARITVPGLDRHNKVLGWDKKGPHLDTDQVTLFLVRDPKTEAWKFIFTHAEADGECGSCGLFWIEKGKCYGYVQNVNPGPYMLNPGRKGPGFIPETADDLKAAIERGLADSKAWHAAVEIKDSVQRADALVKYLVRRTSPADDKNYYQSRSRWFLSSLGKDAVPALVAVLDQARHDDYLNEVVFTLRDIGPDARPAVPHLCKLLRAPEQADTDSVMSALRTIESKEAIPHLRPFLDDPKFDRAVQAAALLAVLGDRDSFDRIAALVPAEPNKENAHLVRSLLNDLLALDPEKAAPIVERIAALPEMEAERGQIKGIGKGE